MKYLEIIKEDLEQWDNNRWVHYSDSPYIKIKPTKQGHQDPAGIYLFPEKFNPVNSWKNKKYKFIVELKPMNILDVSKMLPEDVEKFLIHMGGNIEAYHHQNKEYPIKKNSDLFDRAWEIIIPKYYFSKGTFNKKIRDFGYDAVFDDTDSILSGEVQLLVLDPTKIKVIDMIERKENSFNKVSTAMANLEKILKQYGNVVSEPPKLSTSYGKKQLKGRVELRIGKYVEYGQEGYYDNKYLAFSVFYDEQYKQTKIFLSGSDPYIQYGVGANFNDVNDPKQWSSLIRDIETWVKNLPKNVEG